MDPQFWHDRWQAQEIGFHQAQVNPHLQALWPELDLAPDAEVFVPLCGKSLDLVWLAAREHPVLGVELSALAVEALFEDHGLLPERHSRGAFTEYRDGRLRILCGDFFALGPAEVGAPGAVYDRGALIALPPATRRQYADRLTELSSPGTRMLLITFDYRQSEMEGPPFAVNRAEVDSLYGDAFEIEFRREQEILDDTPRFRERGLTRLTERVYLLRRCRSSD